jgi:hypothetical protein
METTKSCPWCSTAIPAGAAACPKCGAAVEGKAGPSIPGVTEVDSTARLVDEEGHVPDAVDPVSWLSAGHSGPVDHEAVAQPSADVQAEMRRMELEAEIANAGGMLMSATDDESDDAPLPSEEAIAALEAGLIDAPTEELEERARALEVDNDELQR